MLSILTIPSSLPQIRHPGQWWGFSYTSVPTEALPTPADDSDGAVEPDGYHGAGGARAGG